MDKYIAIVVILLGVQMSFIVSEPECSRFEYEEKTLQKLIRLEWKFEQLMGAMESFKQNVKTDMDTKMKELSTLLNGVNERMTTEFEEWKNRKIDVDTKIDSMSTLLNCLNDSTVAEFEKSKMEMEQRITRLTKVESSREVIAFSARNLKDLTPANGQTLIFTDIDFNVGGGYDANTGIFTAPEGGWYVFMTHVCNFGGSSVNYAVINDGTEVLRSAQADEKYYSCHSIPVVTHVRSGGEVRVQTTNSGSRLKQHIYTRPMFSGVLLNED